MNSPKTLGMALYAAMLAGNVTFAQDSDNSSESTNRVAAKTDWSVFVEEDPKECWGVSTPKDTKAERDSKPVSVNRGDILLFVTFRPGSGTAGEVSFTGGYTFKTGSTVTAKVGQSSFELYTDGEWAWPASEGDDAKLVTALKRGSDAVLTAVSERSGTQTTDTFSLMGFTAAMEEAEKRCGDSGSGESTSN